MKEKRVKELTLDDFFVYGTYTNLIDPDTVKIRERTDRIFS
jgi:hypothetical protein